MLVTPTDLRRFWIDLRESVAGVEHDFTRGSLARAIVLLAIPMVLEMGMQSVLGIVDVFFVALLGSDAVAAVGITESLLTLVFSVAIGLSMATTAVVARRIGEKDRQGASRAAFQGILLGTLISLPLAVGGVLFTPQMLSLMGASPSVQETGFGYNALIFGGNLTIMLLFLINGIFRGAGDAALAMKALWLANLLNMVLDPLFIFGWGPVPALGVAGAAVATNIGRGVAVAYQFWLLFSGQGRIRLKMKEGRPDLTVMRTLFRVSLGGILQFLVATASWLALVRIVALFGSAALAGYTIALRILIVALLPSWGLGNAAATLVGQNLGAQRPERAERSVWWTGMTNMIGLGLVTILFLLKAEPLIRLFTDDPQVIPYGVQCLEYVSYGYVFYAYGMVVTQAFNGAGDTFTPTLINLFCYWFLQIPLAYGLALSTGLNATGVFVAITISESLLAVVAVLVFRRGRWKGHQV